MTTRTFTSPIMISMVILAVVITQSVCSTTGKGGSSSANPEDSKPETSGRGEYPPAPRALANAELKTLEGEKIKIADLKGKVVLINLWATWCAPCIEEMPYFVKLQDKYRDDGFIVLGLNSDEESEAQVRKFVSEQELNYTIGWANQAVAEEFMKISKLPGIPQSLLLNRDGEMTGLFRGGGSDVINKMVDSVEKLMDESESKADES